jgi:hypothetical protein
MKAALSAIGLGALIATAFNVASAAPTATTTQTGTGNTAYTEQTLVDPTAPASATIIQVGNNNRAGDPATLTPGILQTNITGFSAAVAKTRQVGNENTASIVQDGTSMPVNAKIRQIGDNNSAGITQHLVTYSDGILHQKGTNNVAMLEQVLVGDLIFQGKQHGSDNFMSIRQHNFSSHTVSTAIQTGSQNSLHTDQDGTLGGYTIEQTGSLNTISSTMKGDASNLIQQIGTGNTATTTQADGYVFSNIIQAGDNNLAALSQAGGIDVSLISQTGNSNAATMTQTLTSGLCTNRAYINQAGNNLVAGTTQTGGGNSSGVYQH